jgi:hypothetical protein
MQNLHPFHLVPSLPERNRAKNKTVFEKAVKLVRKGLNKLRDWSTRYKKNKSLTAFILDTLPFLSVFFVMSTIRRTSTN